MPDALVTFGRLWRLSVIDSGAIMDTVVPSTRALVFWGPHFLGHSELFLNAPNLVWHFLYIQVMYKSLALLLRLAFWNAGL